MALGALVNGGTFVAFTYLALAVTRSADLSDAWMSVAFVLFGAGSLVGVALAGRLSDRQPGTVLAIGGPLLLTGWVAAGLTALALGLMVLTRRRLIPEQRRLIRSVPAIRPGHFVSRSGGDGLSLSPPHTAA